jgi:hypothetical protein
MEYNTDPIARKTLAHTQSAFLDTILREHDIKNDAKLSFLMEVSPPVISKMRNGWMPIGPAFLISLNEATGRPIKDMKRALGLRVVGDPMPVKLAA